MSSRTCFGLIAFLGVAALGVTTFGVVDRRPTSSTAARHVVVRARPGAAAAVEARARRLGATHIRPLWLVDGFAATLPAAAQDALAHDGEVVAIADDSVMHVQSGTGSNAAPASAYRQAIGADDVQRAGFDGTGATVALLDTGVTPSPDLAGRLLSVTDDVTRTVAACANFSGESSCADGYGHGTFLAGIIAGDGTSSGGKWVGVAPGARVLSVKVAGKDGSADVSNVLAAIQWVVSFRDRYGIDVLNLSLGTDSTASTRDDPLNYAVERAWKAGITVVVAASNRGPQPGTISKPGDDPWVVTVGAVDDRGTAPVQDDQLPSFTSHGPTAADGWAKPDLVAPGAHIVSLRSANSTIDTLYPDPIDGAYRKGSGTSMATAVVSGAVAVLAEAHPTATPDQLKQLLADTAQPAADDNPYAVGHGELDLAAGVETEPSRAANGDAVSSSGLGSLDASRGSVRVQTTGVYPNVIAGVETSQVLLWDPLGFVTRNWSFSTWYLLPLYLNPWARVQWSGSNWHGSNWHGSSWEGQYDSSSSYGSPA